MAIKSKQSDQDNEDYQQEIPVEQIKPMGNQPKSYEQYIPTYDPPVSGLQNPIHFEHFEEMLPTKEYDKKQQAILKEGYGNRSGGYNTLDYNTNGEFTMPQGVLRNQYSSDREQNKRMVGNANRSEEIQRYQTGQEKLRQGQQRQQEQQRQQQMQGNFEKQQQTDFNRQQLAQQAKPLPIPASPQSAQPYSKVVAPPVKGGMGTNTVQKGMGSEKKSSIGKTSVQGGMDSQRKNEMQVTQNPNKKFAVR